MLQLLQKGQVLKDRLFVFFTQKALFIRMNLTVPEAAATPDTIQFKLVYTDSEVK